MKIGIIAAMPEELVYLTQNLDKPQEVQVLGNTYYTGSVGNTEVVLVQEWDWKGHVGYECSYSS